MTEKDPLLTLREAIASQDDFILSSSADVSDATGQTTLGQATYIHFPKSSASFNLNDDTRFRPGDKTIDLRSIYFAWQHKDASAQEYVQSISLLNEEMSEPGGSGQSLQTLVFAERLDLNSWLSSAQDDSEYIMPLAPATLSAITATTKTDFSQPIIVDARLAEIYAGERHIMSRTTVLHGAKPIDFTSVRHLAMAYLGRSSSSSKQAQSSIPSSMPSHPSHTTPSAALLTGGHKKPARRPDPIILLSPSASALLRMSNIKRFLDTGSFVPAESDLAPATDATRLQVSRLMPSIDAARPLRFHVVETPDAFKPEHWARLVAVFTTGQAWQFKSYRWSTPSELFARALGVYVGWAGESVPDAVKSWGRSVKIIGLEKWNVGRGESGRWKDREAVEQVWLGIEESMRGKGWSRDGGPK